jgi:short-subunit dehydrogenase
MTLAQLPTQRPTALVTGASSGIGLDLARIFAEHGYNLILVARTQSALEHLATELTAKHGISALPFPIDLRDPQAPQTIFDALATTNTPIDVLVNNAGFGGLGRFDQTDLQQQLDMIQVNIAALTNLTRRFLPGMVERNRGRILNVASTAAFQAGPLMSVYYASKAYVLSFTMAVADELRHTNVTLTALCPGPTRTNFAEIARMKGTRLFSSSLLMSSRDVAQYGYDALMRGKRLAIPGPFNRVGAFATRLVPRGVSAMIARRLQEGL